MSRSTIGFGSQLMLAILVMISAGQANAAGTIVTVEFTGGTGSGAFSGSFSYDESEPNSGNYTFQFGATYTHMVQYTTVACGTHAEINGTYFTITTVDNTFKLVATVPTSPTATVVTITIPTNATMPKTTLPFCTESGVSVFPDPPLANTTLELSGGCTFTGTITQFSNCSMSTPGPEHGPFPTAPCYTCPPPAPTPVYACPPRRGCFLTRLFARGCRRNSCW